MAVINKWMVCEPVPTQGTWLLESICLEVLKNMPDVVASLSVDEFISIFAHIMKYFTAKYPDQSELYTSFKVRPLSSPDDLILIDSGFINPY